MKVIKLAAGTQAWPLQSVPGVHIGQPNCSPKALACHHGVADDCGGYDMGWNRALAYVPYLSGSVLLRSIDLCDVNPDEYDRGDRVLSLYANATLFHDYAGPLIVHIVIAQCENEVQLDVAVFADRADAEAHLRSLMGMEAATGLSSH